MVKKRYTKKDILIGLGLSLLFTPFIGVLYLLVISEE